MTAPAAAVQTLAKPSLALPKNFIPLRPNAITDDPDDGKRLESLRQSWSRYDDLLRNYHRQVEENVRMLAGQQYSIFHPVLQRFLDVTEWMDEDERRWRQRPVFNRLLPWYIITHAKVTENPPIVTFSPGPDRIDAELAEVLDVSFKTLWRELGMPEVNDRLAGWMLVAGRGHLLTRVDMHRGPMRKWIGEADLPILGDDGTPQVDENTGEPILAEKVKDVPHDENGKPLAHIDQFGNMQVTGEPHEEREGVLVTDVLSPLNCRGSWGPDPWHKKREHVIRTYHTPEEVWEMTGIEVNPDVRGAGVQDIGELERILYGTGFYGSTDGIVGSQVTATSTEGYVELTQRWQACSPYPGMYDDAGSPGGRLTIGSRSKILYDGPRPAKFPYTSPLNTFEFVRLPGRPNGSTPQEALNPVQRSYNDGYARIKEHVNLSTNPKGIIDQMSGIKAAQFTNAPGDNYVVTRRPGVPAVEFVAPPPLGEDVYKLQSMLGAEFEQIGQTKGQSTELPRDASGELVKEMRFDDDRYLGGTQRRSVEEYGRVVENWRAYLPLIWDDQKVLEYAGDDNVARTITVLPYMFEQGKVNVVPDVESMLPEGRGERARVIERMYDKGMFGPPGTPVALKQYAELAHFPHLSRALKIGGIDRTTAEQENGQLMQGVDPRTIPVYEWYDHDVHLMILESFMKGPEFKKADPKIQDAFVFHRQAHKMYQAMLMQQALAQQAAANAISNPQPGGGGGGGGGGGPPPKGGGASPDRSLAPGTPEPPRSLGPGGRMPTQLSPGLP